MCSKAMSHSHDHYVIRKQSTEPLECFPRSQSAGVQWREGQPASLCHHYLHMDSGLCSLRSYASASRLLELGGLDQILQPGELGRSCPESLISLFTSLAR